MEDHSISTAQISTQWVDVLRRYLTPEDLDALAQSISEVMRHGHGQVTLIIINSHTRYIDSTKRHA